MSYEIRVGHDSMTDAPLRKGKCATDTHRGTTEAKTGVMLL